MPNNGTSSIVSIERFKPHLFHMEQGEGLFKSHSHAYDELTLILDGEGYYSSPEQNVKVGAGDLIMIPPGLHHGCVWALETPVPGPGWHRVEEGERALFFVRRLWSFSGLWVSDLYYADV
ncbi:cupin domain-containing protein [Paenibacillus vandeheii]